MFDHNHEIMVAPVAQVGPSVRVHPDLVRMRVTGVTTLFAFINGFDVYPTGVTNHLPPLMTIFAYPVLFRWRVLELPLAPTNRAFIRVLTNIHFHFHG